MEASAESLVALLKDLIIEAGGTVCEDKAECFSLAELYEMIDTYMDSQKNV